MSTTIGSVLPNKQFCEARPYKGFGGENKLPTEDEWSVRNKKSGGTEPKAERQNGIYKGCVSSSVAVYPCIYFLWSKAE